MSSSSPLWYDYPMKMRLIPLMLFILSLPAISEDYASEPVGYYSQGTLSNGVNLPVSGPGFMRLFLARNRGWGTQETVEMIIRSSADMNKMFPGMDRLQIGDISQEGGGPVTDLHSSHQNGQDADLTYYRKNRIEQAPNHIDGFSENMVINRRLSKNFDTARNWEFIKRLHAHADVQRIFVDPVIKNELCRFAKMKNELIRYDEILRSLRPLGNHGDHMHVRLRCPADARECVPQEDPPAGTGCSR